MKQSLHMLARDWRSGELRVLALALVIAVASVSSVAGAQGAPASSEP